MPDYNWPKGRDTPYWGDTIRQSRLTTDSETLFAQSTAAFGWGGSADPAIGQTWKVARNSSSSTGVIWCAELGFFVSSGTSGFQYSVDGSNWTTSAFFVGYTPYSVCWSRELNLFVAVGQRYSGSAHIWISANAVEWTMINAPANNDSRTVCWSPDLGIFLALAQSGTGNRLMTSTDGYNWSIQTNAIGDGLWQNVTWVSELSLFIAVSNTSGIYRSADGLTWNFAGTVGQTFAAIWDSNAKVLYVSIGAGARNIVLSRNGTSFGTSASIFSSGNGTSAGCYSPELRRAVFTDYSNNPAVYSIGDPLNGRVSSTPIQANNSICWSPELRTFVAGGSGGIMYSDGL